MATRAKTETASRATAKKKRSRRRTGDQTRRHLIEKSTELFAQRGFAGISTREIAEACGTSVPTIYLYFADKRQLYLACCLEVFQNSTSRTVAPLRGEGSPKERLEAFVHGLVEELTTEPHLLRLFQWELATSDTEGLAMLEESVFRECVVALRHLIGEVTGKTVPQINVVAIFALTFGLLQYGKVGAALDLPADEDPVAYIARYVLRQTIPDLA